MRAAARGAALIAAWCCLAVPAAQTAALESLRLAALAERIAKVHAQAAHGVMPSRSRRALADAVRDFDAALAAAGRDIAAERRENHLLLTILWQEYRVWALKAATHDSARKLADRADEVAWVAARAAREAGAPTAALQAARGAVLSQRVARLLLLRRSSGRDDELSRELARSSAELRGALRELAALPGNPPEAAAELQVAETQHAFLERAAAELQRTGAAVPHLENIAKTGDHMLESLGRLARLYEAAGL